MFDDPSSFDTSSASFEIHLSDSLFLTQLQLSVHSVSSLCSRESDPAFYSTICLTAFQLPSSFTALVLPLALVVCDVVLTLRQPKQKSSCLDLLQRQFLELLLHRRCGAHIPFPIVVALRSPSTSLYPTLLSAANADANSCSA